MSRQLETTISEAATRNLSVTATLEWLADMELEARNHRAIERRFKCSRLQAQPCIDAFHFHHHKTRSQNKNRILRLLDLEFLHKGTNLVFIGNPGVGKTFLASAFGHLACQHGYSVCFLRADAMLRTLRQSRLDNSRDALMTEMCTIDLLIIDDFALEPMSREESRDVYQFFIERNARASTIVTSNRDTADWLAVFDDALLAQSAVDRFRNNAYDLVVDGESYRERLKPNVDNDGPPPAAPVQKRSSARRRGVPR